MKWFWIMLLVDILLNSDFLGKLSHRCGRSRYQIMGLGKTHGRKRVDALYLESWYLNCLEGLNKVYGKKMIYLLIPVKVHMLPPTPSQPPPPKNLQTKNWLYVCIKCGSLPMQVLDCTLGLWRTYLYQYPCSALAALDYIYYLLLSQVSIIILPCYIVLWLLFACSMYFFD